MRSSYLSIQFCNLYIFSFHLFHFSLLYLFIFIPASTPISKNKVLTTTNGKIYGLSNGILPLAKTYIVPAKISKGIIPPQRGLLNFVQRRYSAINKTPATIKPIINVLMVISPFLFIFFNNYLCSFHVNSRINR